MYGAVLGDIIGSRFEFDRGGWTKDFELFTPECGFTDDTVMTVAVAEALLEAGRDATVAEIEKACIRSMQKWGRKYPNAGYGGRFIEWLFDEDPRPYGSWGNGSAMRVAAAGWLYDTLWRTREVARATASVSHNHPEGLKGAECTAAVIYMARTGRPKDDIREYVIKEFGYDLSKSVDELRPFHKHEESCMDALPKALVSFFEGNSFEDVIRNAVSLGGDTDTIAAIAGAMAEGMYGIPKDLRTECWNRIPDEMKQMDVNILKYLGSRFNAERNEKNYIEVFDFLCDSYVWVPVTAVLSDADNAAVEKMLDEINGDYEQLEGKTLTTQDQIRLIPDILQSGDDYYFPIFSSAEEMGEYGNNFSKIEKHILEVIPLARNNEKNVKGIVLNAFTEPFFLSSELFDTVESWKYGNMDGAV